MSGGYDPTQTDPDSKLIQALETTTHKPVDRAVSFSGKHFEVAPDAFRAGAGRQKPRSMRPINVL
jgi:hypothetical protein